MHRRQSKLSKAFTRTASDCSGTAAIEFAIAGPAFIALLLGTISIGWDFASASSIDNAIVKISRQVEYHSTQPVDLASIQQTFCTSTILPGQCKNGAVKIQVGAASNPGFLGDGGSFVDVQPGSINIVRISTDKSYIGKVMDKDVRLSGAFAVYVQ